MTRTELEKFVNDTMDLVQQYLNDGNHDKVQEYVKLIADKQFEYWEAKLG